MDSKRFHQMQNDPAPYGSIADDVLVTSCQQGDNQAFAELMKRHRSPAMKLALSILRDRQDAEDEVQNAFWKAYEHITQFQRDAKFSTWLTRIVVNQCLMHLRQTRRAKFYYMDDAVVGDEVVTLDLPDQTMTPEQQLGQDELADVVIHEIGTHSASSAQRVSSERCRAAADDGSGRQVRNLSRGGKSRLLRARAELRIRLGKHCGDMGPATLFAS